jgi:hypothetical protein
VSAGDGRFGAKPGKEAEEGFGVVEFEFDLDFAGHDRKSTGLREGEEVKRGFHHRGHREHREESGENGALSCTGGWDGQLCRVEEKG